MKRTERTEQTKRTRQSRGRQVSPYPFRPLRPLCPSFLNLFVLLTPRITHAILAGGEFDLPADSPSNRLDTMGMSSPFNFVGGLQVMNGSSTYRGTAAALSRHWVLTAAHNTDFNDDGIPDSELSYTLHLPGAGSFSSTQATTHPAFTGFANPGIHNDLALLYFDDPLPESLFFPVLGASASIGDSVTLVGFGRSGYGSYGYTTNATHSDRRVGYNTLETFSTQTDGDGVLFRYSFHAPSSPLSLGNDVETIIGPGDSGGPALINWGTGQALVGVNTFTEGYGGRFGDIGGGVMLDPAWSWIAETSGLSLIPEPGTLVLVVFGTLLFFLSRKMSHSPQPPQK